MRLIKHKRTSLQPNPLLHVSLSGTTELNAKTKEVRESVRVHVPLKHYCEFMREGYGVMNPHISSPSPTFPFPSSLMAALCLYLCSSVWDGSKGSGLLEEQTEQASKVNGAEPMEHTCCHFTSYSCHICAIQRSDHLSANPSTYSYGKNT